MLMYRSTRRHLVVAAVTLCALLSGGLVAPTVSAANVSPRSGETRQADDRRVVGDGFESAHGRAAVRQLGDRLPEAARRNGMAAEKLRELLLEDQTAWLDDDARLYYQEPAATVGTTSSASTTPAAASPPDQTFSLHSKPGSSRTIYLDFDGHNVSGTVWNSGSGVSSGFKPAWTLDADPATFNDTERAAVQSIWRRVAEDFAAFDVDVTTQEPASGAITRTDAADQVYGTRALISPSESAQQRVCSGNCGGVAYVDVFDTPGSHATYQPAWVFPQSLGNSTKNIAEAVSHEVGHNLGLRHDGVERGASYYEGHSTWAPIMGSSYGRPITQWSQGDYPGADNQQNDLMVISDGGAPLRQDEAPGSVATTTGPPSGRAYITSDLDRDVYKLGVCSGQLAINAKPAVVSPNLDISLSLLDHAGNAVATVNPGSTTGWPTRDVATGMDANFSKTVKSGTYYVSVEGVGHGKPSTGYDGYASVGAYTLAVSGTCHNEAEVPSAPQAVEAAVLSDDGRSVSLAWDPPASTGTSAISHYVVARSGAESVTVTDPAHTFADLSPGGSYTFTVAAVNATGPGPASLVKAPVAKPGRARIQRARGGARGGKVTATARWRPPTTDGGVRVTGYRVVAYRLNDRGRVVGTKRSATLSANARAWHPRLRHGRWKFAVSARNAVGWGRSSARSNTVFAR
jgi:Fibronectin type III domain/Metallo-peptidase family M12B Reprolysin-like